MFENLDIFKMASGLARHATNRQEVVAKNIANADTPEYRAQDVASFAEVYRDNDFGAQLKQTRPGHILTAQDISQPNKVFDASGASTPNGNTVSLETEMMKSVEARHEHELALSVYKSSLNILRGALGRR